MTDVELCPKLAPGEAERGTEAPRALVELGLRAKK